MVAMLSDSSAAPYTPLMPMQPSAMGKTLGPVVPSLRLGLVAVVVMRASPVRHSKPAHEMRQVGKWTGFVRNEAGASLSGLGSPHPLGVSADERIEQALYLL
jgi:hypothetical protein